MLNQVIDITNILKGKFKEALQEHLDYKKSKILDLQQLALNKVEYKKEASVANFNP